MYPLDHFFVFFSCEGARCVRSDELGCESEQFLVGVFTHFCDDLCVRESWVDVFGVGNCAGDTDFADCLEFVCVGDDVADKGVVWRKKFVEVERSTCEDCFVFSTV